MEYTTATRRQVLAAYRADATVTVRDLQARFRVGKSTIAGWLREEGLSRQRGARIGAAVGRRVEVEPDFRAVLLGWYGSGAERQSMTANNLRRAAQSYDGDTSGAVNWLEGFTAGFRITSPAAAALVDRAVGKSWRAMAMERLMEQATTMTRSEWSATFGEDYPAEVRNSPALLRRAALDAVDLKRKVRRRLEALAKHPEYEDAVKMFTTHWMSRRPAWMRSPRGRS